MDSTQHDGSYSHEHAGRMRIARAALGMSTAEFARRFNVKRRTVQRIETGMDPTPIGLWADVQHEIDTLRGMVDDVMDLHDQGGPVVIDTEDHLAVQAAAIVTVALDRGEFTPAGVHDTEDRTHDEQVSEQIAGGA